MSTDPKLIEAVARALEPATWKLADEAADSGNSFIANAARDFCRPSLTTAETAITAYEAARGDGVWVPSGIEALRAEIARYEAAAPLSARETARYLQLEQQLLDAEIMTKG